jgi:hypothetical protein
LGESFDARCKACGTLFNVSIGGGFNFDMLHCEVCGKAASRDRLKKIDTDDAEEGAPWGRCGCGGELSHDAPPRCPTCRSSDFEAVGNYINYD